jgi:hypothetical protein
VVLPRLKALFFFVAETDLLQPKEILPYSGDSEIPLGPKPVAGSL